MAREEQQGGELRTAFLQKVLNKLLITAPLGPLLPQQPLPNSLAFTCHSLLLKGFCLATEFMSAWVAFRNMPKTKRKKKRFISVIISYSHKINPRSYNIH